MDMGTMAIINNGVPMEMTIMAAVTTRKHKNQFLNISGTTTSMASTSLENLFIIRPSGVVSKKLIGERKTFTTRL